jgi:hypothetical protein
MDKLESRLEALETEVAALKAALAVPSVFRTGNGALQVNDTLIQWGTGTSSENSYVEVSFPDPFSDVPVVVASINTQGGGDFDYIAVKDPTPTKFTFFGVRPPMAGGPPGSVPSGLPISWLAIGKKTSS